MSILPGEGEHLILYGSFNLPAGTQIHTGYMARPDEVGAFPTVLVVHDIYGLTSHEKEVCRRLARHGITAVAIDLYRGEGPARGAALEQALEHYQAVPVGRVLADLDDAYRFVLHEDIPGTQKEGLGILGLDVGGRFALFYAASQPTVHAVAVCYAPLAGEAARVDGEAPLDLLGRIGAPVLGLYGKEDDLVAVAEVERAQRLTLRGEWVLYEGAGHDFLNESLDAYDHPVADDALQRLIHFFRAHLPAAEIVPVG